MTLRSPTVKLAIGYGIGVLILAAVALAVRREASAALHAGSLVLSARLGWEIGVSLAGGLAATVLSGWSWARALKAAGVECSAAAAHHMWYASLLARYIPGTVPGVLYRIHLAERSGASRAAAAAATAIDWVLWLVTALLAALLTAAWWIPDAAPLGKLSKTAETAGLACAAVVCLLLLHPWVLNRLLKLAARRAGAAAVPTYSQILRLLPIYLVKWPFYGLSLAAFLPLPASLAPATGAFGLGWTAGFLSPFSPGGVGVREGVIIGALHGAAGPTVALQAALLCRLTTTAAELLCWAVSAAVQRRKAP